MTYQRRLARMSGSAVYGIALIALLLTAGTGPFLVAAVVGAMVLGLLYTLTAPSSPEPRMMRRERRRRR